MPFRSPVCVCCLLLLSTPVWGATIDECREMLIRGKYSECVEATAAEIAKGAFGEAWHQLKAEAEFRIGNSQAAMDTIRQGIEKYSWSVRLRWLAIQVVPFVSRSGERDKFSEEISVLVQGSPWRYTDADNLVSLAEFVLWQGADAKQAQDAFLTRARRNNPTHRGPILALGNLALQKRDFQLAADIFRPALETRQEDPDLTFGLSRALAGGDPEQAAALLQRTLELNPHHLEALQVQAERLIDGEQYAEAAEVIGRMLSVNPRLPEAFALLAVIAHVQGRESEAEEFMAKAFADWAENPAVAHLYGRKLSQKYRFTEGAQAQRDALKFDPDYLPAKKQLAEDLLRLGQEQEGWKLADEAYQTDQYDIGMYNLVTLRDELEQFTTIDRDNFLIRMDARESRIYGDRVGALLATARRVLCDKYRIELDKPILVEIFPKPADFAVRTFGIPGVSGYLGVCFGDVITANSPASQDASPVNLEAVLWHEFAHVVTLNKTRNRMPRWLSEGISVHEERSRDSAWGEKMTPAYRKMILEGELTPVSELSSAFLSPKTPLHLQFAYFESSLVVEYLIEKHGFESLLKVLDDLAVGMGINEALERNTVPIGQLDEEFARSATQLAEDFGKEIVWSDETWGEIPNDADSAAIITAWIAEHPGHYTAMKKAAAILSERKESQAAIEILRKAVALFPYETGSRSPAIQLATLLRQAGEVEEERRVLEQYVRRDDDAVAELSRLIELATAAEDWPAVRTWAERLLAVRPLNAEPHASLASAAERLGATDAAIGALSSLLELGPADPVGVHYRLAVQLENGDRIPEAETHVLKALEDAPRFRDALALLKRLNRDRPRETPPSAGF